MKMRLFLLPFLAITMVGCASGPKYADVKGSIPALQPDQGRIYFYRPSAIGAAVQPNIRLNGDVVGEMKSHGFFFVDRSPGNYVVSAQTESEATLQLALQASQTQYVQGSITIGFFVGRPQLTLMDATNALIELQDLAYIGTVPLRAGSAEEPAPAAAAPPASQAGVPAQLKDLEGLLKESAPEKK